MKVRYMKRSSPWAARRRWPRYERDDGPISATTFKQIVDAASRTLAKGALLRTSSLFARADDNT